MAGNLQPACLEQVIISFELSRFIALVCGLQASRKTEPAVLIDSCEFSYDIIVKTIESNGKSADACSCQSADNINGEVIYQEVVLAAGFL